MLLAEGDSITAHVLRHRLERDGTAVDTSTNGPSTLEKLQSESFDAAVLDADLIGIDGLDILRRIRVGAVSRQDLPVLVLTWPGNDGLAARAYDLDADIVMGRPLSLAILSAGVRRLARTGSGDGS
ncbi:response regulator transcription factor [Rubrivirga sp.]|uniref:response regulator transcription factor n=1 Tax=Rubrivirga sp. TaxID=1885344 RepID=UPI003C72B6BD